MDFFDRYIRVLYHLTEAPVVHSWESSAACGQLIGEFSGYTKRIIASAIDADGMALLHDYDHEDRQDVAFCDCLVSKQCKTAKTTEFIPAMGCLRNIFIHLILLS
jgi:hypothetical protein